ncbi:MAG: restriction endonuclease [Rhodococcus qingshengii]
MEYIMTPHQAELNAAEVMKSWGYIDSVATTGGADGGIDVTSRDALAQVKWRGGAAGRPDLQKLYGARGSGTQQLMFFAASSYTDQAIEYADQVKIALFIYDPVGAVEPVNDSAKLIVTGGAVQSMSPWTALAIEEILLLIVFTIALVVGAVFVVYLSAQI